MPAAAAEPQPIDLCHLGHTRVLCAWRMGEVLVDPGPASCLPVLLDALAGARVSVIALTHIHLDHAGATGTLLRSFPDAEVWVHERGARHLVDPSRLLDSARRLYGEAMGRLWGEVAPVPARRIRALQGGETLDSFSVAYTPGHARHHVAYLHEPSAWAFTGDVAGVRIGGGPVLPPTPPPDIDLEAWRRSLQTLEDWHARQLALTHFGAHDEPAAQLREMRERLEWVEELAARGDERAFCAELDRIVRASSDDETAAAYAQALPTGQSFLGLRRHLEAV